MNLLRLLLFALIVWLVWRLFLQPRLQTRRRGQSGRPRLDGRMVRCHHCALHIPVDEALKHGTRDYCSEKCLEQDTDR